MTARTESRFPTRIRLLFILPFLSIVIFIITGCGVTRKVGETVDKTTKTVSDTTRVITRTWKLSDEDLLRKIGIINFENKAKRDSGQFQNIFHRGLPEYLNENCEGILVEEPDAGGFLALIKKPPKLESGHLDNYSLAVMGRQLGLNAIITGSLEDIRFQGAGYRLTLALESGESLIVNLPNDISVPGISQRVRFAVKSSAVSLIG